MPIYQLSDDLIFPPPRLASKNGLLAIGGDLQPQRLLLAYQMGIFPWYAEDDPIMWWSPDPRLVLYPKEFHISASLKKVLRQKPFQVRADTAFEQVIRACAHTRRKRDEGTWIVEDMIAAYTRLHADGFAHSVESWFDGQLVGGLYGISLGACFFGESMFSKAGNASKVALAVLVDFLKAASIDLIDCQVTTSHLMQMGAREVPRRQFLKELEKSLAAPTCRGKWYLNE